MKPANHLNPNPLPLVFFKSWSRLTCERSWDAHVRLESSWRIPAFKSLAYWQITSEKIDSESLAKNLGENWLGIMGRVRRNIQNLFLAGPTNSIMHPLPYFLPSIWNNFLASFKSSMKSSTDQVWSIPEFFWKSWDIALLVSHNRRNRRWCTFFWAVLVFNKENAKFWSILALFWLSCREFTNFLVYFLQPK